MGDKEELIDEVFEENESLARSNKKQDVKDLLFWGIQGPGSEGHEDVEDEDQDEDEDIISLLTMFLEEGTGDPGETEKEQSC